MIAGGGGDAVGGGGRLYSVLEYSSSETQVRSRAKSELLRSSDLSPNHRAKSRQAELGAAASSVVKRPTRAAIDARMKLIRLM